MIHVYRYRGAGGEGAWLFSASAAVVSSVVVSAFSAVMFSAVVGAVLFSAVVSSWGWGWGCRVHCLWHLGPLHGPGHSYLTRMTLSS